MNVIKKLIFTLGIILSFTNTLLGTEVLAYYENDITPPWGRIYVEKSVPRDGISYVGSNLVTARIYANDDICKDEEIKYYISTEEISDTSKLADNLWKTYKAGESTEITLDEDGTKKIYAIFKDANGNTSLIYEEDASNTQNIVFDANGGFGVPENINTIRVHGMSYILPTDAPYKRGYTFLGWSTDSKANVPSYREGDAIPPDASLGTEDETTLYAIYGTDLSTFPDLVDVVEIGDYVNYPVYYDNPEVWAFANWEPEAGSNSKLNGWRVLSSDKETGEVTLVSAGVPLGFYFGESNATAIANKLKSTTEFLNIGFASRKSGYFDVSGLTIYNSLIDAFTNKYTKINEDIPEVRSMTKADVDNLYQYYNNTTETTVYNQPLDDEKYKNMIDNGPPYYLATVYEYDSMLYNGMARLYAHSNHMLGIRPVVTLRPDVKAIGQNINGAWDIGLEKEVVLKPTPNVARYTGAEQTVSLKNFDSEYMEITGTTSAIEPGAYTVVVKLKDTIKYEWPNGTSDSIELTWNIEDIAKGDFIEYGIEYTDIYTSYKYSGDEGWRLLSKTDNEDGTSNIEIISTGIPAKLYYYYAVSDSWWANTTQATQYKNDYYVSLDSNVANSNMRAAAGLLYNFEKIEFSQGTGTPAYSKGLYTAINGNQDTGTGLFKANNISKDMLSVRSVMHADLKPESIKNDIGNGYTYTDAAEGLFTLQNLAIDPHNSGSYWLASPMYDNYNNLRAVNYNGSVCNNDGSLGIYSVRPIVSISNVQVLFEDGMWKIK